MALAGAQVSRIDVSPAALARAKDLTERYSVDLDLQEMPGEDLRFEDKRLTGFCAFPLITIWTRSEL
jgi:hypothetical protein